MKPTEMKEFKTEVYKEYMKWVNEVSDDLEDKSYFTYLEIVDKIVDIVLENWRTVND